MRAPEKAYERRKRAYDRLLARQQQADKLLSNYRLFAFAAGLTTTYLAYQAFGLWLAVAAILPWLCIFPFLALQHQRVRGQMRYAQALSQLNYHGLRRMAGEWGSFTCSGAEFAEKDHPYASDLDLFGQASLFQWINSAATPEGRARLAQLLKHPDLDIGEIGRRQQALLELAENLAWRQRLQAEALIVSDQFQAMGALLRWAEQLGGRTRLTFRTIVRTLPIITLATLALLAWTPLVPWQLPVLLGVVQWLLLRLNSKRRGQVLSAVEQRAASLQACSQMLTLIEELPASSV